METDESLEVLSALADSEHRLSILQYLDEGPSGITDISSALDVPRATVKHNLQRLEEMGFITSRGSDYEITTFGIYARTNVTDCLDRIAVSEDLLPFLEVVPRSAFDPAPELFQEAKVTPVSPTAPHAPVQRLIGLIGATDYHKIATPVVLPRVAEAIYETILEDDSTVDLILQKDAYDGVQAQFPDDHETAMESERLLVGIYPETIPFGMFRFEDRLALVGHDEDNIPRCLVETNSSAALDWADDRFRELQQDVRSHEWHDGS